MLSALPGLQIIRQYQALDDIPSRRCCRHPRRSYSTPLSRFFRALLHLIQRRGSLPACRTRLMHGMYSPPKIIEDLAVADPHQSTNVSLPRAFSSAGKYFQAPTGGRTSSHHTHWTAVLIARKCQGLIVLSPVSGRSILHLFRRIFRALMHIIKR